MTAHRNDWRRLLADEQAAEPFTPTTTGGSSCTHHDSSN